MPDGEEWRPVVGYDSAYEVSNQGRVRSVDRVVVFPDGRRRTAAGRLLKPGRVRGAHQFVNLGKGNSRYVHQLVAEAFLGPRPPGLEVCHGLGGVTDNSAANLRYGTHGDNMRDMLRDGTHPQARKTRCKNNHEFTGPSQSGQRRRCLVCKRESQREARKNGAAW